MPLQFGMYQNQVQPDIRGGLDAFKSGLQIAGALGDMRAAKQQRQEMQALQSLMADPANFDQATGQLNYQKLLPEVAKTAPGQFQSFSKMASEQQSTGLQAKKQQLDMLMTATKFKRDSMMRVMTNPTVQNANQVLDEWTRLTGDDSSDEKAAIASMTPDQIKRWAVGHAAEARDMEKLMPQFKLESFGGFRQAVGVDPLTGETVTGGQQMPMTATPGESMADARARAQQAEQRRQFGIREQRIRSEAGGAGAGKPPSGYRWSAAGDLEPIPGGPAEKPTKLPEAQQKQAVGVRNLNNAIANYRQKLSTFSKMDMLNPSERAKMGTAYNNMMLQAKEAFNLGVLNGPDFDILQSVIMDPRSISAAFVSKDALDEQASELSRIMGGVGAVAETQVGAKPRAPARAPAQSFENMPNPAQYNGRIIRDDQSGTRWRSDGKQWLRVK